MSELIFYLIIFLANIIQGITGFAGTILAMPFSVSVVGYDIAKPVLNVLGILAGVYVVLGNYKQINLKLLKKICLYMTIGIIIGIIIKNLLIGQEKILYLLLGLFVLIIGVKGLIENLSSKQITSKNKGSDLILLIAGIVHGMFVCGGPLVVSYLSSCTNNKDEFRRTISAVWIILNTIILINDIFAGYYVLNTIRIQIISIVFLFCGMFVGGILYKHMNQKAFMILTYVLLCVSGLSLIIGK